jgi:hypothetical protein
MSTMSPLEPHTTWVAISVVVSLFLCWAVGLMLVPRRSLAGSKLMHLAVVLGSGLLWISSIGSVITLGRWCYLAIIPIFQVIWVALWHWRGERGQEPEQKEKWTGKEICLIAAICAGAAILFHVPYHRYFEGGTLLEGHQDHGYFVQQVIAIPEAGVANMWGPVLGPKASEATGGRDLWYHWGPTFVATLVQKATGLPGYHALMDVSVSVMNIILVLLAGAMIGTMVRAPVGWLVLAGAISLVATQLMMMPGVSNGLVGLLKSRAILHTKTTLAVYFTYKFESMVLFAAALAWLGKSRALAFILLISAAISAPHTVAAMGAAAGVFAAGALLLRKGAAFRWAAGVIVGLLVGVLMVKVLGSEVAGGVGQKAVSFGWKEFSLVLTLGLREMLWSVLLSAVSLPGILHLIRARDAVATAEMRMMGWLALSGVVGSCWAAHLLEQLFKMADRYHVMIFIQVVLVMPMGIWGLVRIMSLSVGMRRVTALALLIASLGMGVHDLWVPLFRRIPTRWQTEDLARVREILQGQPLGYWGTSDGGWWFSKHGVLGSMLGSRILRINPLATERDSNASQFYGYSVPLKMLPPDGDENLREWATRFARKVGVEYVAEIGLDTLPVGIRQRSDEVFNGPGLRVYRLRHAEVGQSASN